MKAEQHRVDPMLASMVPADEEGLVHDELVGGAAVHDGVELVPLW
jgi:hypothetical protein